MTLDQIKTLCRIIECGTLQKAAISLHKTQPALSMAIKKLEAEYGFQILTRDHYRLTLTEAGRSFYYKAQELLQSASQLNSLGQHLGNDNEAKITQTLSKYFPSVKRHRETFASTLRVPKHT